MVVDARMLLEDPSPVAPIVPGITIGRHLGGGRTSTVWSGIDVHTGDPVAVKVLPLGDDLRSVAVREATLLARIEHEHILRLHRAVPLPDVGLALVVELAAGGSCAALVAGRRSLDPGEVVTILTPIAGALAHLHDRGLVHGDVAPGNVLFGAGGRPLLGDLGYATVLGAEGATHATPGFADPLLGPGSLPTPAADVFSLGSLAWFCLTGRIPPAPEDRPPMALLRPDCPEALTGLVEQCLRADADLRPTAAELAVWAFASAPASPVRLVPSDPCAEPGDVITHRLRRDAVTAVGADEPPSRRSRLSRWSWWSRSRWRWLGAVLRRGGRARGSGPAHRRVRRRLPVQRIAVTCLVAAALMAVLAAAGALAGAGAPAGDRQPKAPAASGPAGTAVEDVEDGEAVGPVGPLEVVSTISDIRAQAFSTGDRALLDRADVAGSEAMASDLAVLERLADQGAVLHGLELTVEQATLVHQADAVARVRVTTAASAHSMVRVSDSVVLERMPASSPRTVLLDLARIDDTWLIAAVLAPRE